MLLIHIYLAQAHCAYGECNVFIVFVPASVHRGRAGQMHYLANVPGIEHTLAIKVLMLIGGGGVISQNAMQVAYISIMYCSLPVISLLTCCQKEVLKACTCLYSQAARHSGIYPPPLWV